jgi:DNA-binding NarL/FixJ family response regulator
MSMLRVNVAPSYVGERATTHRTFSVLCGVSAISELVVHYLETISFEYDPLATQIVLLDAPQGFALRHVETLGQCPSDTIVVTNNHCPEYLEDLWALQPAILLASDRLIDGTLATALEHLVRGERYRRTPGQPTLLTPCERLLLRKLARGWSNKRIAACHGVSSKTVTNTVALLCQKLNLSDRVAAALYYWGRTDLLD